MKIRVNRRKVNYKKYRQPLSPHRRALGVAAIAVCSAIAAYLALLLLTAARSCSTATVLYSQITVHK